MPEYRIELNVKKGSSGFVKKPKLTMRQGEKNSTLVVASIRDADIGYDLTGKTVEFRATVPGGRIVVDDDPERVVIVDGKNGVVSYLMPSRVAAEPGSINNAYFDVYTSVGEYEISTESFSIEVYDGVDLTNEAAADYIPKFDRITAEAQAATAAANDAAKSASETNESVKSAEAERAEQERARVGSESSRAEAEAARAKAETSRATDEGKRASAEADRASKEAARRSAEESRAAEEGKRATAEAGRASGENARQSAETARAEQESARNVAESARVDQEALRVSAEASRESGFAAKMAEWQADVDGLVDPASITADDIREMVYTNHGYPAG